MLVVQLKRRASIDGANEDVTGGTFILDAPSTVVIPVNAFSALSPSDVAAAAYVVAPSADTTVVPVRVTAAKGAGESREEDNATSVALDAWNYAGPDDDDDATSFATEIAALRSQDRGSRLPFSPEQEEELKIRGKVKVKVRAKIQKFGVVPDS
jgi:hypothetical protein